MERSIEKELETYYERALEHTRQALEYMASYGIRPEGKVQLFLPPEAREKELHTIPYRSSLRQTVVYETEPGEFSALCPFSGLPDYGVVRIEYVPGSVYLELKSLKYYLISWRNIGITQEEVTSYIFEDVMEALKDPEYLVVTTVYNIRGGIRTTCRIDSRELSA